jgi:tape measure domain-containing protein
MATSLKELIVTFEANAKPVVNALNKIDSKLKHTTESLKSTGESFTRLGKEIGLNLSLPLATLGGASLKTVADIQSLEASLTSVLAKFNTGVPIQQAVANEIEHLRSVTTDLGVSFSASVKPYTRYLASSKDSLETNRKVMKSFLGLSAGLGLTSEELNRVIRALEQMQSKGKVMSEELKLQLGDAVPGAVGLFAEAMGVSEAELFKLMEQGKVSSDVLSKVADTIDKKYGAAIDKGSKTIRANANRIANAFYMLRVNVGRGMDEAFKINDKMASFATWLTKVSNNFAKLDENGKKVILSIGLFLAVIAPLLVALGTVIKILGFAVLGFKFLLKPIILLVGFLPKIIAGFKFLLKPIILLVGFLPKIIAGFKLLVGLLVGFLPKIIAGFKLLVGFLPKIIAGFRLLGIILAANPLGAFVAASSLIIIYWKEIVGLFRKAFDWLSKISLSGIWSKFKDFVGFGDGQVDISSGPKSSLANTTNMGSIANNQKTVNNNLTVNIPPGISGSDATAIKDALKQALQEENRQSYIELGAQ